MIKLTMMVTVSVMVIDNVVLTVMVSALSLSCHDILQSRHMVTLHAMVKVTIVSKSMSTVMEA